MLPLTWAERAQLDPALRAFVDAEICRAGIRLDTLEYQNDYLRRDRATLIAQLDALRRELTTLRRQLARVRPRDEAPRRSRTRRRATASTGIVNVTVPS